MNDGSFASDFEMLDVVVPPCIGYPGSGIDPCERRDTWREYNPYVQTDWQLVEPAPSLEDEYLFILDHELHDFAPQFVVRAIPIPNTTRCGTYNSFGPWFDAYSGNEESASDWTRCWVDLAVNEYILKSGPARLTIDTGVWAPNLEEEGLKRDARVIGERLEGWEWIITLNAPWDPNSGSWRIGGIRDVQARSDGAVVVVSWTRAYYLLLSRPEFRDVNLDRSEMTLSEFRRRVESAYGKFSETTGGRIFVGHDINGNALPSLAGDATDDSIRKYISELKVVAPSQYTINFPPDAQDENRPNSAGLTVNDIIATRVAGGVHQ